jgi:hypothetical protein
MVGRCEFNHGVRRDGRPGLGDDLAVDPHLAGQDQRARPLARCGQSTLHEDNIEALLGRPHQSPLVVSLSNRERRSSSVRLR